MVENVPANIDQLRFFNLFKLLLICGGPSPERGISLNSTRSIYDNIGYSKCLEVKVIFVGCNLKKYFVDEGFLYSNTTSDFDFKIASECEEISENAFVKVLKDSDLVFPIIHGKYGEDGILQKILEENNVKFVASGSNACEKMYNKKNAENHILKEYHFGSVPKLFLDKNSNVEEQIKKFFQKNNIEEAVIKPIEGGSSFGVEYIFGTTNAIDISNRMLKEKYSIVVEKYCKGKEFTVVILQNSNGEPISLIPTEIEIKNNSMQRMPRQQIEKLCNCEDKLFTTRRKYLPTNETYYYTPPRFLKKNVKKIREQTAKLFKLIGAKDFLRIDGWILENNSIYYSDFNPISGMEQNSFIFQQGSKIGFTHNQMINYILKNSAKRQKISFPETKKENNSKKRINVLLGGVTSERQVSLMSGSNVWLKLLNSKIYKPYPYLITQKDGEFKVLELSYDLVLNHTVEEIIYHHAYLKDEEYENNLIKEIRKNLGILNENTFLKKTSKDYITLDEFIENSKKQDAYVFLGLHGGFGEDGSIQKLLEDADLSFNGSGSKTSVVCMDKYLTGKIVDGLNLPNFRTAKKISTKIDDLIEVVRHDKAEEYWENLTEKIGKKQIVIKPQCDGCSTGVVILTNENELKSYVQFFIDNIDIAQAGTFKMHDGQITIGITSKNVIFEEYIIVDKLEIIEGKILYNSPVRWIELTVGVLEKQGEYHAMNPSITIAKSGVLSLEEKFQGGTGVNITPPPEYIISKELTHLIRSRMEDIAKACEIKDYCRIDIFANNTTKEIIVIEINTLPGLSPSTVLFQQAAKEIPTMNPTKLLEHIVSKVC